VHDGAVFHDELCVFQQADVLLRVAPDRYEVRELAGARYPARVDRIPQSDIGEGPQRAHIVHRGETGQQRVPRAADTPT